jgi:hypothetical protein
VFGIHGAKEEGYIPLCGALFDLPKILRFPGLLELGSVSLHEPRQAVLLVPEPVAQLVSGAAPYGLAAGSLVHPLGFLESVVAVVVRGLLRADFVGHLARHVGEVAAVWKANMNSERIRSSASISTSLRTTGPIRMPTTIASTTEGSSKEVTNPKPSGTVIAPVATTSTPMI